MHMGYKSKAVDSLHGSSNAVAAICRSWESNVESALYRMSVDHVLNEDDVSPADLGVGIPALCLELLPALRAERPRLHVAIISRGSAFSVDCGERA